MTEFKKNPLNPIFGSKELGTCFDVLVWRDNGRFRMDFSWRAKESLAVSFSDDGIHWEEPIITLAPDPTSGWEDKLNRNAVIKKDGIYEMWYTGQARGYSFIGAAKSTDGIHFERISPEPVMIAERYFENASVMNPCVLFEDGVYRMWYAAGETYEPNVLCYAESTDGIEWKKSRINPIYICDKSRDYERERVGGCQVLKLDFGYVMFYIGYRDIHTACICAAYSENGITEWKRCKKNPLVVPTEGEWDADSCYKPSALYDERLGGWHIWYNGRHGYEEYIGEVFMPGNLSREDFE